MAGTKGRPGTLTIGTDSRLVFEANLKRLGAIMVNDSDTPIYLALGDGPAALNSGIRINANGGAYEISVFNNPWLGQIHAIAAAAAKNLCYQETE